MSMKCILRFIVIMSFINLSWTIINLSEMDELTTVATSRLIIERIRSCNNEATSLRIHSIDNNESPMIHDENDVICGQTKIDDIVKLNVNRLDDQEFLQFSMISGLEALIVEKDFASIGAFIDEKVNQSNNTKWITLVGKKSSSFPSLEERIPIYVDYMIAHVRIRIFNINSKQNQNSDDNNSSDLNLSTIETTSQASEISSEYSNDDNEEITESPDTRLMRNMIQFAKANPLINFQKDLIHVAAAKNLIPFLKFFITEKGVDGDLKDKFGRTPAAYAALNNNSFESLKYLLGKQKLNANVQDNEGNSLIHLSASINNVQALKYLIRMNLNASIKNNYGESALHIASRRGAFLAVRLLVEEAKLNVNDKNLNNETPLFYASQDDANLEIVKYLIRRQAIPQLIEENQKNKNIAEYLSLEMLKRDEDSKSFDLIKFFNKALENDDLSSLKYIIEKKKINCDYKFPNGRSFIHLATDQNRLKMIDYLLKCVDVNLRDSLNRTSMHYAAQRSLDLVKFLFDKGADVSIDFADKNGETPIFWSIREQQSNVLAFLADHQVNIEAVDNDGFRPIHYSIMFKCFECFKYLITNLKSDSSADRNGLPVIYYVIESNSIDLLKFMLENVKLDVNQHDAKGRTPLDYALKSKNLDIAKLLIEKGAELSFDQSTMIPKEVKENKEIVNNLKNELIRSKKIKSDQNLEIPKLTESRNKFRDHLRHTNLERFFS